VIRENGIVGDDRQTLESALCNEDAVERVTMLAAHSTRLDCMPHRYSEFGHGRAHEGGIRFHPHRQAGPERFLSPVVPRVVRSIGNSLRPVDLRRPGDERHVHHRHNVIRIRTARNAIHGAGKYAYLPPMAELMLVSLDPSPTIEAYKAGVDRTLLRENLKLTPAERVEKMIAALRFAEAVRASRPAKG
jgi:hypothetical protein